MAKGRKYISGDEVKVRGSTSPITGIIQTGYWSEATNSWLYSIKWTVLEDCPMFTKGIVFRNIRDEIELERCHKLNRENPNICYRMLKGGTNVSYKEAKAP